MIDAPERFLFEPLTAAWEPSVKAGREVVAVKVAAVELDRDACAPAAAIPLQMAEDVWKPSGNESRQQRNVSSEMGAVSEAVATAIHGEEFSTSDPAMSRVRTWHP